MGPLASLYGRICALLAGLACACFADVPDDSATTSAVTSGAATTSGTGTSGGSTSTGETSTSTGGVGSSGGVESTGAGSTTGTPEPVYTCPDSPELVLCYELEAGWGEALLIDSADAAHHGFMMGVSQAVGHKGSAAAMVGESRVYVTYDQTVFSRLQDAFTVGAWIRPAAGDMSGTYGLVEREGHFKITLIGGGSSYKVGCTTPFGGDLTSVSTLEPDTWAHVACVYDGVRLGLWVNGALEGDKPVDITSIGNKVMWIGNIGPDPTASAAFVGLIDEIQLWEIALEGQALCAVAGLDPCGGPG